MSTIDVPFGSNPKETAILLLGAARDLGYDEAVVATTSDRTFVVPEEVHEAAFGKKASAKAPSTESVPKTAAKKTAAKKAPAKKSAAKKSTAKKSQG